jgi:hypothetical protein
MTLEIAIILFMGHYIGDFVLQNRAIAENKSSSIPHLLVHGLLVGATMFVALTFLRLPISAVLVTVLVYTALHCLQDKFIWKMFEQKAAEKAWTWGEPVFNRWFFRVLGLDQMLHMIVLFGLVFIFLL